MNPLYNLGIRLYGLGISAASHRSEKVALLREGQKRAVPYLAEVIDPKSDYIWIHAASLGEFEQGRPFIEALKRDNPEYKILLTFFSPSGYEVRKNYPLADAISYLPLDTPGNVRKFLDTVNPRMAIFVKYEFWGNYLQELSRRGVPTYLISAIFRPGQVFFRPWGAMFRGMMKCYRHIFLQDENSRKLLEGIGVTNTTVAGDTRFDRVVDIMNQTVEIPQCDALNSNKKGLTLVAGSTWPGDEEHIISYFNSHPEMKLIIAPHEVKPERIEAIESALQRPSCRLSSCTEDEAAKSDCIIVDCYGKLSSIYRYGEVAYVGGGFGVGIHNLNEAAVYGMPVIFGPNYGKFKEAHDLIKAGGGFSFDNSETFNRIMDRFASDHSALASSGKAAGDYIARSIGATKVIYNHIFGK